MMREKKQNGDSNSTNFRFFFFKMSFNTWILKVPIFASELEFQVKVNEYYKQTF